MELIRCDGCKMEIPQHDVHFKVAVEGEIIPWKWRWHHGVHLCSFPCMREYADRHIRPKEGTGAVRGGKQSG